MRHLIVLMHVIDRRWRGRLPHALTEEGARTFSLWGFDCREHSCCIKITLLLLQPYRMIRYGSWGEIKLCVVLPLALSQSRWRPPPLTQTVTVAPQPMRLLPGRAPILVSMAAMAGGQRTISPLAPCNLLVASSPFALVLVGGSAVGRFGYNWKGGWR